MANYIATNQSISKEKKSRNVPIAGGKHSLDSGLDYQQQYYDYTFFKFQEEYDNLLKKDDTDRGADMGKQDD